VAYALKNDQGKCLALRLSNLIHLNKKEMPTPINCDDLKTAFMTGSKLVDRIVVEYGDFRTAGMKSVFLQENILLFALEGDITFRYGNVVYNLKKQEFAFFRKDILLEYRLEGQRSIFLLVILKNELVFQFATMEKLNTTSKEIPETVMVGSPGMQLSAYFDSLEPYFNYDGGVPESLVNIKLLELLFCLSRNHRSILEQILDCREHFRPNITNIVEDNLMDSLSLRQLARLAGRSVSSFRRDFLSIYNMPPSRWMRQKKLEKAQELLVSTNMTVTSICYTLGFESIAHFSRIFKSHFGYPPSGIRMHSLSA
jgi:AraC family transcriptional regulator, exoenzyme S synthesis regulatory protein ExsA